MNTNTTSTVLPGASTQPLLPLLPLPIDPAKRRDDEQREVERRAKREARQLAEKIRQARREARLFAIEHQAVVLRTQIDLLTNPATDPRLKRDLCNDLQDRAIGKVGAEEAEAAGEAKQQAKQPGEHFDLLEMLAAFSAGAAIVDSNHKAKLGHTRDEPVERDITPAIDDSFEELMNDIDGEHDGP